MRRAKIYVKDVEAGILTEIHQGKEYVFEYHNDYRGLPVSQTMPIKHRVYKFYKFPPFFDGLLPEGIQLQGLLQIKKLDKDDYFSQLITVGDDLVGVVSVKEFKE